MNTDIFLLWIPVLKQAPRLLSVGKPRVRDFRRFSLSEACGLKPMVCDDETTIQRTKQGLTDRHSLKVLECYKIKPV